MVFEIILQLNPTKGKLGMPHDSTEGIPPLVLFIVYGLVVFFGLYTFFKVRKLMKDEQPGRH